MENSSSEWLNLLGHVNTSYPKSSAAYIKVTYRAANAIQFDSKLTRIETRCMQIRSDHLNLRWRASKPGFLLKAVADATR